MPKLYFEIIDECIDKFRLDESRTFNFSLLDFRDDVFHNYGLKPPLEPAALTLLLEHAQDYVRRFGMRSPVVKKITDYLQSDLRSLASAEEKLHEIYQVLFEGKAANAVTQLSSNHIARFVSILPLKHYWDNSGLIYQRVCRDDKSFAKVYLCQFSYDENRPRSADVLCREIEIPQDALKPAWIEHLLFDLHELPFSTNAQYFGLKPEDEELYELYGRLFDMLNWGASNLETVMSYFEARSQKLTFYNCVFPLVLHGIYYGIAYFDLPPEFFQNPRKAAETLSQMLEKGWTFVHHYFPAIIIDAYNSRLIGRFTRERLDSAQDVIGLVNSKVPFRFCYDRRKGMVYYFKFPPAGIKKEMHEMKWQAGLDAHDPVLLENFMQLEGELNADRLYAVPQEILDYELIFFFDMANLPGKEKCRPILESHLGQAAIVLQTMKVQGERKAYEQRGQLLDMMAHDTKTTRELLIADLEEGMDSDLAALQLSELNRKERIMREHLLGRVSVMEEDEPEQELNEEYHLTRLDDLFWEFFTRTWRAWLKSRRYRASFRRNCAPGFALNADSSRAEVEAFVQEHLRRSATKEEACLAILRESFANFAPQARIVIQAQPMELLQQAILRVEAIFNNLFSNYFKHTALSPATKAHECAMIFSAEPASASSVKFRFAFHNSSAIKERFREEIRALFRPGPEMHGLQIVKHLIERGADRERRPEFNVRHENHLWQLEIERECFGCKENSLVVPPSRG